MTTLTLVASMTRAVALVPLSVDEVVRMVASDKTLLMYESLLTSLVPFAASVE